MFIITLGKHGKVTNLKNLKKVFANLSGKVGPMILRLLEKIKVNLPLSVFKLNP